jgi:hypothetical protein
MPLLDGAGILFSMYFLLCRNLRQSGGIMRKMTVFPLTPALSRRERENVQGGFLKLLSIRDISWFWVGVSANLWEERFLQSMYVLRGCQPYGL